MLSPETKVFHAALFRSCSRGIHTFSAIQLLRCLALLHRKEGNSSTGVCHFSVVSFFPKGKHSMKHPQNDFPFCCRWSLCPPLLRWWVTTMLQFAGFFFIKTQYLTCMCSFLNVPMFMCYPSPSVTSISWLQSHSCLHSALSCCNRRIFLVITKQGSNGLDLGFSMGCIKWSVGTADVSTCVVSCGCLFVYF